MKNADFAPGVAKRDSNFEWPVLVSSNSFLFLDPKYLSELSRCLQSSFREAEPFPHVVIDNFLPEEAANRVLKEFPGLEEIEWKTPAVSSAERQHKFMSQDETQFKPCLRHLLYHMNSGLFLHFLESLTGIGTLLPDPDVGTALRHFGPGGRLEVHTDFNWHKRLKLHRRLNLILYLNEDWRKEYGGSLELWDEQVTHCVKRVLPRFNRAIIFVTEENTPHGFPQPVACPEGQTRKSIQLYYYTSQRPDGELHAAHGTIFRRDSQPSSWVRMLVRKATPPILLDWVRRLKS